MNFHLKDLQLHFDAALLNDAEAIISSGDVQKIVEIKKDCWQLSFDYEGAVCQCQINAGKVRKYSCNCVVFSLYKKCKHVAAICLMVQKIRLRNTALTKPGESLHFRMVPLGKILQHTSQIELTNFLLEYSKHSPEISNAIRARFIFNYPEEITPEKDFVLTLQVEKFLTAKRPSENSLFDIYKSIEAYFAQSDSKLDHHETILASQILNIISKNLLKLMVNSKSDNIKLIEFHNQLLIKLHNLYKLFIAPEAKKKITEILIESLPVLPIVANNSWHEKYANILLLTCTKESDYPAVKQIILQHYFDKIQHIENKSNWLIFTIQADLIRGEKPDLSYLITRIDHDIDIVRSLITRLISKLHYDMVISLIKQIQKDNSEYYNNFVQELTMVLLEMYIRSKNWKKTESLVLKTYPIHPDSRLLNNIKEHFPVEFELLWDKLLQIKLTDVHQQLLLELSLSEVSGDFSKPMETITSSNDIKLLANNDQLFWDRNKSETLELYKRLSKFYLETHFGEPAQEYIRQLFHHLDKTGHREESKLLKKFLQGLFSERKIPKNHIEFPVL